MAKREKKVLMLRHGPKATGSAKSGGARIEVPLSEAGVAMMEKVANLFVKRFGKPSVIHTSLAVRTYQTGMILHLGTGGPLPEKDDDLIGRYWEWDNFSSAIGKNPTVVDFYKDRPGFIEEEAVTIGLAIKRVAIMIEPDQIGICVGHGGIIEPTIAMLQRGMARETRESCKLSKYLPKDLEEGQGFLIRFDEENNFLEATLVIWE